MRASDSHVFFHMAKGWLEKNGKSLYSYDTDRNKFWTVTNVKFHPDYPCSCWIGSSNLCPHQIHIAHKSKNHPNVNFDQENLSKLTAVSVYVIEICKVLWLDMS